VSFDEILHSACAVIHRSPSRVLILASRVMSYIARFTSSALLLAIVSRSLAVASCPVRKHDFRESTFWVKF